ncbi:MAG: hypothetical protein IJW26_06365 [Clostridia bacterium]|nr:hypothetical protein [Clostridia bacterium]
MKVYFYSKIDAVLKINGSFVGKIDKNPSCSYIEENSLLEFLPLIDDYNQVAVYNFSSKNAKIFKLKNSLLVCPTFLKKRNAPYKIINQKTVDLFNLKHLFTILADGSYKFYLNGDFYVTSEIPFLPADFNIEQKDDFVFISFTQKKKCLYIYHLQNNTLSLCFNDVVDDYSYSFGTLKTYKNYKTIVDVNITETWTYDKSFTLTNVASEYDKSILMANEKIKGLFFINLLTLNGDVTPFLSSNLLQKASAIKEFLEYPYLCFENFESANDNEYLLLTKNGAKCLYLTFKNNLIEDFMVDDY